MSGLKTRKPTGLASWPIALLAGREGAGKSWAAAAASGSPLLGRTLWIGIGEDDPDEYALIPGARFEIVEHDGTYAGILGAVQAAVAEPADGLPTMIVVDSMSRLWALISGNAQQVANRRAKGRKNPNGDYTISADLWNVAAEQWRSVMNVLREHTGPVVLTARLDQTMVMENGQPTNEKVWKVQAHKTLVFDAAVIVEMHERGHALITKAKSARMAIERPMPAPGFTIPGLWERLGIGSAELGSRSHASERQDQDETPEDARAQQTAVPEFDWVAAIDSATSVQDLYKLNGRAQQERKLGLVIGGASVADRLRQRKEQFEAAEKPEPLVADGGEPAARDWLAEARPLTSVSALKALLQEAKAQGATDAELAGIGDLAADLERQTAAEAGWAGAGEDAPQWVAPGEGLKRAEEER